MPLTVWLPRTIANEMVAEADRWFGLETGGTFMGYWANDREMVVTANIPAGPAAKHERFRFEPDQAWQQSKIDLHYEASGRLDTYLGDWHTHPNAVTSNLSHTDRSCIRRIISTKTARQARPVMLLLTGKIGDWSFHPHVCATKTRWGILSMLQVEKADARFFAD